jgi:murein DD-endopeptidase MepM/ murein hydrolase activator NlpD
MMFPIPFVPKGGYRGSRGFDADRSKVAKQLGLPSLRHTACDLMAAPRTPIMAVEDGVMMYEPQLFYPLTGPLLTYEVAVRHISGFIARYCEIDSVVLARPGETVKEGQVIAYVGDQPGDDMLHFEMFSGKASGSLSTNPKDPSNAPYYRRSDLIDPTPYLDRWQATARWPPDEDLYPTRLDSDERVFLIDPT